MGDAVGGGAVAIGASLVGVVDVDVLAVDSEERPHPLSARASPHSTATPASRGWAGVTVSPPNYCSTERSRLDFPRAAHHRDTKREAENEKAWASTNIWSGEWPRSRSGTRNKRMNW